MSTVKFDTWQNTDGTENYKCRAWVNFNGTGTVAIRESGNVSSITDNGVGAYTVNFTTAMPDSNYAFISGSTKDNGQTQPRSIAFDGTTKTISAISVVCELDGGGNFDNSHIGVAIFR